MSGKKYNKVKRRKSFKKTKTVVPRYREDKELEKGLEFEDLIFCNFKQVLSVAQCGSKPTYNK